MGAGKRLSNDVWPSDCGYPDLLEYARYHYALRSKLMESIQSASNSPMLAMLVDITTLAVDAIVNAANNTLLGGGGVDGAIHRAAGADLLKACVELSGCATGEAKISRGFALPAKFVIHTVGPVWTGGNSGEDRSLLNCYEHCLNLAETNNLKTVAFPAISCGVYGYPIALASKIAVSSVARRLLADNVIEQVTFACFNRDTLAIYALEIMAVERRPGQLNERK
jgi:O-acetyl-ADP-ribose deacetylase (regulator of RNase III)